MQNRNWIPALPLAVLFALQATAPNAQEAVGKARCRGKEKKLRRDS
jgi:hypothetical protein